MIANVNIGVCRWCCPCDAPIGKSWTGSIAPRQWWWCSRCWARRTTQRRLFQHLRVETEQHFSKIQEKASSQISRSRALGSEHDAAVSVWDPWDELRSEFWASLKWFYTWAAPTFHHGHELPHSEASHWCELSQRRFQEKERYPSKHQGQEIRDQESPWIQ